MLKDVTLVEANVEADQDVHLVIRDDHNPLTDAWRRLVTVARDSSD